MSLRREGKPIKIVPILADKDAEIPFFLKEIQYSDLSNKTSYEDNLERLADTINRFVSGTQPDDEAQIQRSIKYLDANIKALKSEMIETERKRYRSITTITSFLSGFFITLIALIVIWQISNVQGQWPVYALVSFTVIEFVVFILVMLKLFRKVK